MLQELADQLGGRYLAVKFAKDYIGLWEQRERRLTASLDEQDSDAALDAVISMKVSSAMVGALRLEGLARALEAAIRGGDFSGGSVLALIAVHGRATVDALQVQYLQHHEGVFSATRRP